MKPLINAATNKFLQSLENKVEEDVVNYISGKDELDRIILKQNLAIRNVFFDKSLDLVLVILNNSKIIKRKISEFNGLAKATATELIDFEIDDEGIHWIALDYDLSLKGLLEHELVFMDKPF